MSLLDRIRANQCGVEDCQRERHPDAPVCRDHLGDLWANRLERVGEVYVTRRVLPARDDSGWIRDVAA